MTYSLFTLLYIAEIQVQASVEIHCLSLVHSIHFDYGIYHFRNTSYVGVHCFSRAEVRIVNQRRAKANSPPDLR